MRSTRSRSHSAVLLLLLCTASLCLVWGIGRGDRPWLQVDVGLRASDQADPVRVEDPVPQRAPRLDTERVLSAPDRAHQAREPRAPLARWTLRGRVLDPLGRTVAGALVALVSLHDGAPEQRGDRAVVTTDEGGRFALDVPTWARGAETLVIARRKGWQPHSARMRVDHALLQREHEFVLGVGNEISGRVVRAGAPVAGARVAVDAAYGTGGVFGAGSEAWWANDRLEEKHGETSTATDGSFRIAGLGAYDHRLEIGAQAGGIARIGGHLFAVPAPDSRVYDLTGALLAVTVYDPHDPVQGALIRVSSAGHGVELASGLESVPVEVPARAQISIDVTYPTSRPVHMEVESPAAGQLLDVAVTLETITRPSLTVTLPGAQRAGIERLDLRMQHLAGHSNSVLEARRASAPDTYSVAVVPLDEGRYRVTLEPSGGDGASHFILPHATDVDLPAAGDTHIEFPFELGGRCEVEVSSPRAGDWSAVYRVIDHDRRAHFERRTHHTGTAHDPAGSDIVLFEDLIFEGFTLRGPLLEDAAAAARRSGVIPPGGYTLEVESEGHVTWTGPVTIEAEQTTSVDVLLSPHRAER